MIPGLRAAHPWQEKSRETAKSCILVNGIQLEEWWRQQFGFGYDCLTRSEGYYMLKTPTADRIRSRIIAAFEG